MHVMKAKRPPFDNTRGSLCGAVALCAVLAACGKDDGSARPVAPPDAVPERVALNGEHVELGTKLGTLRKALQVSAFQITKSPVTVAEYRRCVDAKACATPSASWPTCQAAPSGVDGPTYGPETLESTSLPVTCVTPEQAEQFCSWVGGSLPRLDQFTLAARGPEVRRFAWGDEPATCEHHWRQSFNYAEEKACCGLDCTSLEVPALAETAKGVSPRGLEAVLAARGEIISADAVPGMNSCGVGARACVVTGQEPGAIDTVVAIPADRLHDAAAWYVPPAGFRCVWGVKS
jgi:hypothetical protein